MFRQWADEYCNGKELQRVLIEAVFERFIVLADEKLTTVPSESGRMLPPGFVQQLRAMKRSMEGAELFGYCDEVDRLLAMLGEGKHG